MVMIRCPNCGQRTLDVASKCPKCGHVLLQNPLEASAQSDLVSCRRCGKHIDRRTAVCPYCGHHVSRARKLMRAGWVFAGLAVVAAAGYGAWRGGYLEALIPKQTPAAATAPSPQEPVSQAPPTAQPIVVLPVDSGRAADSVATAPPTPQTTAPETTAPSPSPVADPPGSFLVRWTSEWANVRESRSIDSPVVRVLAPGSEVRVARMRDGWWEYYESGAMRGYIANSVLGADPPANPSL
jgi:ribosomal protein L37E